jgi:hypothetical protein
MRFPVRPMSLILSAVALAACGPRKEPPMPGARLWPVDPLVKVFRDAEPPDDGTAPQSVALPAAPQSIALPAAPQAWPEGPRGQRRPPAERRPPPPTALAARNEVESLQFVLRSDEPLTNLRARVAWSGSAERRPPAATVAFVGFVPVRANTPRTPPEEIVRKAPGLFPDPLLPPALDRLEPKTSLPIWVTLPVPKDARPGDTRARLVVESDQGTLEHPFVLRVAKALLPDERTLWVTNWFAASGARMKQYHGVEDWSEEHWGILRSYARVMAAHRQNVVLTPLYSLIGFQAGPDGKLAFDFARFDRWVSLFQEEGVIGLIEGSHLGGRGPWTAPQFDIRLRVVEGGKVVERTGHPGEPAVETFLAQFLPALQQHLEERGWLGLYLQHLCDEPIKENAESYRTLAALVRKYAPKLRRIDANHYRDLVGSLDVWVPQLNYYNDSLEFYQQRQRVGEEVWTYTCLAPTGTYPNRLIDYSLLKVRLLHWLNFRFGTTGYLHWGWNQWRTTDPLADVEPPHGEGFLPPGDGWIVYPSKEQVLLSSIRFEAMRDGIEDYELLRILSRRDLAKAVDIAQRMVPEMPRPEADVAKFRQARQELIEALSK